MVKAIIIGIMIGVVNYHVIDIMRLLKGVCVCVYNIYIYIV